MVTATVDTMTPGEVQAASENTKYVTEPLAWKLLVRVAESETLVPTGGAPLDRLVVSVGVVFLTIKGSQGDVDPLLFGSPL